jgi:2-methylisocitrate lyase-like PEP mutase family enzyme
LRDSPQQHLKASRLLELHHDPKLLILPNIWDALGARLIESLGFPAVATASAAVAWSLGCRDGEVIPLRDMLGVVSRVAAAVKVPVTADIERGYADSTDQLQQTAERVIEAGAVGVNIEDSLEEAGPLRPLDEQVRRLRAVRAVADRLDVPLVINARIDAWLGGVPGGDEECLDETIARARAYLDAGADCVYPIGLADMARLKALHAAVGGAPVNVMARPGAVPLRELEAAGIARVSVGPGLIKVSLSAMERAARELLNYGSYDVLTDGIMSSDDVGGILSPDD